MKRHMIMILTALITAALIAPASAADMDGEAILQKANKISNSLDDLQFKMTMTTDDGKGNTKVREMMIYQKGNKRLAKFMKPANEKGMAFLSLDSNNSMVYLPSYKKVRRIASHVRNQTFLGSTFTYEDFSTSDYTEDFTGKLAGEEGNFYIVDLMPKPGSKTAYQKLQMKISKDKFVIHEIRYFSPKDGHVKTETRTEFKNSVGEHYQPHKIEMIIFADKSNTTMTFVDCKYNQNLSDDIFSSRNIKRPVR